jgi:hypothetical protein
MGGWVGFEFARGMGGAKVYEAYEVEKKKGKFTLSCTSPGFFF